MSAERHLSDAERDGITMLTDFESVLTQCRRGIPVEPAQLEHLMRAARAVMHHVSVAQVGLRCMGPGDPRVTVTPAMPTLPQLLAPAQKALDDYHDQGIGGEAAVPITFRGQS